MYKKDGNQANLSSTKELKKLLEMQPWRICCAKIRDLSDLRQRTLIGYGKTSAFPVPLFFGRCSLSGEGNKAREMPARLFPLSRDRRGRNCFGAFGASMSPVSSKSIEFRNAEVFAGVLYAKCHCFAIRVCKFTGRRRTVITN